MCQFYQGQYQPAIDNFERSLLNHPSTNPLVSITSVRIRFAEKTIRVLSNMASRRYNLREIKNMPIQIDGGTRPILSKSNTNLALPHLEYYDSQTSQHATGRFLSTGVHAVRNEKYPAIRAISKITGIQSDLGQNASFYLADCYLKTGIRICTFQFLRNFATRLWSGHAGGCTI